jgi:putative phage-type endonuclease
MTYCDLNINLKVKALLGRPQPVQRTPEWYALRNEMLTASDWGTAMGCNKYSNKNTLLRKKCSDADTKTFFGGKAIDWGVKYEPVANKIYEYRNNTQILEFGCIQHLVHKFLGASPDGITYSGKMLEIKCPFSREITGEIPHHYWIQIQGQLEVCDLDACDYLECKFAEYNDGEEYFNDISPTNSKLTANNMEKGCILIFINSSGKFSHEYAPLGINKDELGEWQATKIIETTQNNTNGLIYVENLYWRAEQIFCVEVARDVKWFADSLPILKSFWDEVLLFREKGTVALEEYIDSKRTRKKSVKTKGNIQKYFDENSDTETNECMFSPVEPQQPLNSVDYNCMFNTSPTKPSLSFNDTECLFTNDTECLFTNDTECFARNDTECFARNDTECFARNDTECLFTNNTQCVSKNDTQCFARNDTECLFTNDTQCLFTNDTQCLFTNNTECFARNNTPQNNTEKTKIKKRIKVTNKIDDCLFN